MAGDRRFMQAAARLDDLLHNNREVWAGALAHPDGVIHGEAGWYDVGIEPPLYKANGKIHLDPMDPRMQEAIQSAVSVSAHNLMSDTHTDTSGNTIPDKGKLIVGTAGNKWTALSAGNTSGYVLKINKTLTCGLAWAAEEHLGFVSADAGTQSNVSSIAFIGRGAVDTKVSGTGAATTVYIDATAETIISTIDDGGGSTTDEKFYDIQKDGVSKLSPVKTLNFTDNGIVDITITSAANNVANIDIDAECDCYTNDAFENSDEFKYHYSGNTDLNGASAVTISTADWGGRHMLLWACASENSAGAAVNGASFGTYSEILWGTKIRPGNRLRVADTSVEFALYCDTTNSGYLKLEVENYAGTNNNAWFYCKIRYEEAGDSTGFVTIP